MSKSPSFLIAVVGPCGAGKSSLVAGLVDRGYQARQIAQEHSFVAEMWKIITKPEMLVYLEASFETCDRRKGLDWGPNDHQEQIRRLAHARLNCDLLIETDSLTPPQVLERTLKALDVGHTEEGGV